jgi:predicted transcriptional regulator of viral defense system
MIGYYCIMKRTILSGKELKVIEDAIAKYGVVVTFDQLSSVASDTNRQSIRNFVSKLSKKGWLVRIKKGLYFVAGIESLGFAGLSVYKIARLLCPESYVSFEAALQYHGMFNQGLRKIVSVSKKVCRTKALEQVEYKFIKAREKLFYGFEEQRVENYSVNIAYPEKAILDLLCFARSLSSVDLVLEKLKEHKDGVNAVRLNEFAARQPPVVQKIIGFLMDKAGIDSLPLSVEVRKSRAVGLMLPDSKKFNAKWRLYYDSHFEEV